MPRYALLVAQFKSLEVLSDTDRNEKNAKILVLKAISKALGDGQHEKFAEYLEAFRAESDVPAFDIECRIFSQPADLKHYAENVFNPNTPYILINNLLTFSVHGQLYRQSELFLSEQDRTHFSEAPVNVVGLTDELLQAFGNVRDYSEQADAEVDLQLSISNSLMNGAQRQENNPAPQPVGAPRGVTAQDLDNFFGGFNNALIIIQNGPNAQGSGPVMMMVPLPGGRGQGGNFMDAVARDAAVMEEQKRRKEAPDRYKLEMDYALEMSKQEALGSTTTTTTTNDSTPSEFICSISKDIM